MIGSQGQEARGEKQEARSKKQDAGIERQAGQASRLSINAMAWNKDNEVISKPEIRNPKSETVRLIPLGANKNPEIVAEGLLEGKVNYLIGNDPKKWTTNIPSYKSVVYKDIYKNIDMKFYGNNRQMEYDIIVKPGANPSRVQFLYEGVEDLRVNENGDMEIIKKNGSSRSNNLNSLNGSYTEEKLIQKKPYIYQVIDGKKVEIEGKFRIMSSACGVKNQKLATANSKLETCYLSSVSSHSSPVPRHSPPIYGFQVASYDKRYPVIIDPALSYSILICGKSTDACNGIAVDSAGTAYVIGYTTSSSSSSDGFPITINAFDDTLEDGGQDGFVTKIGTTGDIIYSTYLGGSGTDTCNGIAVDGSGTAYVTGYTTSSDDFPITDNAFDSIIGGRQDGFVTKLGSSTGNLEYLTYLGGSGTDTCNGIAVDGSGNAYVTGYTSSVDFGTVSAYQEKHWGGFADAFVTRLNNSGTDTTFSTYLGGTGNDIGGAIAVDGSGTAYVTGYTTSTDFPIIGNALDISIAGRLDGFVAKVNTSGDELGNKLQYSTYLGGVSEDTCNGIIQYKDKDDNVYITGQTRSPDFTATGTFGSRASVDAFITKISFNTSTEVETNDINQDKVKANSATLTGKVNVGGLLTTAWFDYGISTNSYVSSSSRKDNLSGEENVEIEIIGLSEETEYYYRLVAENSEGITYGNENSFTTKVCEPEEINVSKTLLKLNKNKSNTVTVTLRNKDEDCYASGETVKAVLDPGEPDNDNDDSRRLIRTDRKRKTNKNGEAVFTIKAKKNNLGIARIIFSAKKKGKLLKDYLYVEVIQ